MTNLPSRQSESDFTQRVNGEITAEEYVRRLGERVAASKCPLCGWKLDADPGLLTWCDQTDDPGPVEVVSVHLDAHVA